MSLRFTYQFQTKVPVELEGLVPDTLCDCSLSEIERKEVYHGNEKLPLAELFRITGSPSDLRWEFDGGLGGVHWLGAGMADGEIHIDGDVGRHLGSEMTGGTIFVTGNAGDWVGGEMHGGRIHVNGSAGHLVGAAYRGSRRGMTGGSIFVQGKVGNEVGLTMRRGLIAVGGECGDLLGFNMLAGTVLVFGNCGIRPGAGMRRGTIALLGDRVTPLLPTFRYACRIQPLVLSILFREISRNGFAMPAENLPDRVQMYHGDMLEGGRGEILLADQETDTASASEKAALARFVLRNQPIGHE